QRLDRFDDALGHLDTALAVWRDLADPHGEGITLHSLGDLYRTLRRVNDAIACLEQALVIRRSIADDWGEATTLRSLGDVLYETGRTVDAHAHWRDALTIFEKLGDPDAATVRHRLDLQPSDRDTLRRDPSAHPR
ncbi:MAG TPA: tetratricopeptide repeat protein, partial [Mycobacteriales bacterium]